MSIKKKLAAGAVFLGAVVGALGVAAPAQAATSTCTAGYSCTYGDGEYLTVGHSNWAVGFYSNVDNFSGLAYDAAWVYSANDSATSVFNNGNTSTVRYCVSANYKGSCFTLARGTGDAALSNSVGNAPSGFNDAISSGKFI